MRTLVSILKIFIFGLLFAPCTFIYAQDSFSYVSIPGFIQTGDKKGVNVRACPSIECETIGGLPDGGPYFFHYELYGDWVRYNDGFVHKPFVKTAPQDLVNKHSPLSTHISKLSSFIYKALPYLDAYKHIEDPRLKLKAFSFSGLRAEHLQFQAILNGKHEIRGHIRNLQSGKDAFLFFTEGNTAHCYSFDDGKHISFTQSTGDILNKDSHNGLVKLLDLRQFEPKVIGFRGFEACILNYSAETMIDNRPHHQSTFYAISKSPLFYSFEKRHDTRFEKPLSQSEIDKQSESVKIFYHPHVMAYRRVNSSNSKSHDVTKYQDEHLFYYNSDGQTELQFVAHKNHPNNILKIKGKSFTIHTYTKIGAGRYYDILANSPLKVNGYDIKEGERISSQAIMAFYKIKTLFPKYTYGKNFGFVRNIDQKDLSEEIFFIKFEPEKNKIFTYNPYSRIYIQENTGDLHVLKREFKNQNDSLKYQSFGKLHNDTTPVILSALTYSSYNDEKGAWYCEGNRSDFITFESNLNQLGLQAEHIEKIEHPQMDHNEYIRFSKVFQIFLAKELKVKDLLIPRGSSVFIDKPFCSKNMILLKVLWSSHGGKWGTLTLKKGDVLYLEQDKVSLIVRDRKSLFSQRVVDIKKSIELAKGKHFQLCLQTLIKDNPLNLPQCDLLSTIDTSPRYKMVYHSNDKVTLTKAESAYLEGHDTAEYYVSEIRPINSLVTSNAEYFLYDVVTPTSLGKNFSHFIQEGMLLPVPAEAPSLRLSYGICDHEEEYAKDSNHHYPLSGLKKDNDHFFIRYYMLLANEIDVCAAC